MACRPKRWAAFVVGFQCSCRVRRKVIPSDSTSRPSGTSLAAIQSFPAPFSQKV
ncbi:hypothetical protein [Halarchaeum acidiphilum]